jgi:diguanylate cyclase (GGDEF)-like protein
LTRRAKVVNKPTFFWNILVLEDQQSRKVISLEKDRYTLGRDQSNSIVVSNIKVSRVHATFLRFKNDQGQDCYRIIDGTLEGQRSTNGLYINGKRTHFRELKHGDHILFGEGTVGSYYVIVDLEHSSMFDFIDEGDSEEIKLGSTEPLQDKTTIKSAIDLDNLSQKELVRLASFSELSPNPIIEMDLSGRVTYLNPTARAKFKELENPYLEHPLLANLLKLEYHENGNLITREVRVGKKVFEEYIHYLSDIKVIRIYVFEVTERKKSEEILEYQAFYDALTGLPNRSLFNEYLSTALANAKRSDKLLAVMFIDVDNFKGINDLLGHEIGDRLLRAFGKKLKSCLREGDLLGRWGGDEFTLMLANIDNRQDVINIAQRILEALDSPLALEDSEPMIVKGSIGIALFPQDGEDTKTIVHNADTALLMAKKQGRNRYQFCS